MQVKPAHGAIATKYSRSYWAIPAEWPLCMMIQLPPAGSANISKAATIAPK